MTIHSYKRLHTQWFCGRAVRTLASGGKYLLAFATALVVAACGGGSGNGADASAPPPPPPLVGAPSSLLPNVQAFLPQSATWVPTAKTRIVLDAAPTPELESIATTLAHEFVSEGYLTMPPVQLTGGPVYADDVHLAVAPITGMDQAQGYRITLAGGLHITGVDAAGVFYGSRTVLQALRTQHLYSGTVSDWPRYAYRGVMLDIGRKYYAPQWIEQLIRDMSWLKLNTLQLHMSEGLGFRIESQSHPEIVSAQYLTKDQVRAILAVAARYHVEVVPDIDSPGHMDHLLASHPEWRLKLANGTILDGHLDYSILAARQFVKDLVAEMADLFPGTRFQIGGDEFFPAPWQGSGPDTVSATSAPQLLAYARSVGGPSANIYDGYKAYMNELGDLVRSKGKIAGMWNDDIYPGDEVIALNKATEISSWIRWNTSKPSAGDLVAAGYPVINANGDYLYFILTKDGVGTGTNKNPKGIYESWTPRRFMGAAGGGGNYDLPDKLPMTGAHLSIWGDSPDALTQAQVSDQFAPWMGTFAQQIWNSPKLAATYLAFQPLMTAVGTAPFNVH